VHDIATTAELGAGKRRVAHVMGMYGTILFWVASIVLVFCYTGTETNCTNSLAYDLACWSNYDLCRWILVLVILRVDVLAEAHPWYRIIKADLFVLALLACATTGLAWSYFQSSGSAGLGYLFLILFITSNIVLFGGVYWSKFAHMIYKPGAAIQKT